MRSFFFPYLLTYGRTFPPPSLFFNTYRYVDTHLYRGFFQTKYRPNGWKSRRSAGERGTEGIFPGLCQENVCGERRVFPFANGCFDSSLMCWGGGIWLCENVFGVEVVVFEWRIGWFLDREEVFGLLTRISIEDISTAGRSAPKSRPRTPKITKQYPYILTGGAGAPTGFARTFPMRDEPAGR